MNILIINTISIPSGEASVNRILSYSQGLIESGDDIFILSTGEGDAEIHFLNGIKYKNIGSSTNNILSRIFFLFMSLIVLICNIVKVHKEIDCIIIVSNSVFLIYPLWIVSRIFGIKLVQEKSEFPFVLRKRSLIGKFWAKFYTNTIFKLFDGMIVMTEVLNNYLLPKVRKQIKNIVLPMTVDSKRFDIKSEVSRYGDYIAYCGDMAGNKDGVLDLIEAFKIYIERSSSNIKLVLIGASSNQKEFEQIKLAANILKDQIVFTGRVERSEIPILLKAAKVLALARPQSIQSSGGFPTKLGEYLATKNPVIVTKVGEIPKYLQDGINAFLSTPNNPVEFAEKIEYVINNYSEAEKVGELGYKLTQNQFSNLVQGKRLHNYLNNIIQK